MTDKEAMADPMREVQRLGQEIEQEPVAVYGYCPECGAKGVQRERRPNGNDKCANGHTYPSSKAAQPAQRTEQEPVELPCCGYTDASAVKWNPFNGVVQCHNCGQTYTPPKENT